MPLQKRMQSLISTRKVQSSEPVAWHADPRLGHEVCQLTPDLLASGSSLFIFKVPTLHQVLDKSAASIAVWVILL